MYHHIMLTFTTKTRVISVENSLFDALQYALLYALREKLGSYT